MRNQRVRRQSEDILENLNWYLGEHFTKTEIKTLRRKGKLVFLLTDYKIGFMDFILK